MKLYIFIFLLNCLCLPKNFIYNKDSWYNITSIESITSISYNYDQIFFSSTNGLFIYDKYNKDISYANYILNNVENKNIYVIHYDSYRDKIWIKSNQKFWPKIY